MFIIKAGKNAMKGGRLLFIVGQKRKIIQKGLANTTFHRVLANPLSVGLNAVIVKNSS